MTDLIMLLTLAAPLTLASVAILARFCAGVRPRYLLLASRVATTISVVLAVTAGAFVATAGPATSREIGLNPIAFSLRLDALSVIMFGLVAFVGFIVVRFSQHYLDGDKHQGVFFGRLCLTLCAVSMLVLSGSLFQLVVAWIGTSIALHRLLVFYGDRPRAAAAARKKFICARIGDAFLILAAVLLYVTFGTGDIGQLLKVAREMSESGDTPLSAMGAAVSIVLAATFKSAQFPFHGWLTEMMETPTPVSALLHAGIVNAGGFLVVRLSDVVAASPLSLYVLVVIGGLTALLGTVVTLTQTNIKASLAWSTVSQMGFMLLQCGFGAFSAATLHIVAHSLYKAHAFLAAGSAVEANGLGIRPVERIRPLSVAAAALCAGLILVAVGTLLGATPAEEPAIVALGAILAVGLTQLLARGIAGHSGDYLAARFLLAVAGLSAVYIVLQLGAMHVLAGAVAEPVAPDTIMATLMGVMVLLFGAAALFHCYAAAWSARWPALYVHVSNGFYANSLFDRLLGTWDAGRAANTLGRYPMGTNVSEKVCVSPISVKTPSEIQGAVKAACRSVAPCWPLKDFVAVNPFLGLSSADFAEVAGRMAAVAGARLYMPRTFYAEALATGRILEEDLEAALQSEQAAAQKLGDTHQLRRAALESETPDRALLLPTVAGTAQHVTGTDWPAFICDRISRWAAAYYDDGQATWTSPWRDLPPYAAWRAEALVDCTPAAMGLGGFRAAVALLPEWPEELIEQAVQMLGIPAAGREYYFHRLLMTQGGWAGYARYRDWQKELTGEQTGELAELLAIRLAWELIVLQCLEHKRVPRAWQNDREGLARLPQKKDTVSQYAAEILLQRAFEYGWQRQLLAGLEERPAVTEPMRPAIQAAFCIDVRSEVYRRALEACSGGIETTGFAGFFGVPMAYAQLAKTEARPQCPALIAPQFVVQEGISGASPLQEQEIVQQRKAWQRAAGAWKSFKSGAVASFSFVETVGLTYMVKLLTDSFGFTRPVTDPRNAGLPKGAGSRLHPRLAAAGWNGTLAGLDLDAQVNLAAAALRGMSRTDNFARLVVIAGHGSTSTNNPHAASLACGACGGHSGEPNARVMASVLNDAEVRTALAAQGITIPQDTVFIAANHDTTSDTVTLFDTDRVPEGHMGDLEALRAHLLEASNRARRERAAALRLENNATLADAFISRGRDWSQVRPEWGLAGCAAFIAAPRQRTSHLSLGGRAFLHDYDWQQDEGFAVLESVMTAPLVVASWITMQYYASTVDNRVFGSGNKTLHNVVGALGVLEGNGGDLRTGLPWQSVHDGEQLMHEPVRMTAVIEAPVQALNTVINKHKNLQALLDNGWIHLYALDERGTVRNRYSGGGEWAEVKTGVSARVVAA